MTDQEPVIVTVVGTRPNFIKIAPIVAAFRHDDYAIPSLLVHTGQHYDVSMKHAFFDQLGIPEPDVDLGVGPSSAAAQTADIIRRFETVLAGLDAIAVLVVGDVTSTLACALAAAKTGIPVLHVEAGLRSFDRSMPEEINRLLTDQLSELLFTTEESAAINLAREGIAADKVHFVGNVMVDTLLANLERAVPAKETLDNYANSGPNINLGEEYGVLTMHRPANVDTPGQLTKLLEAIGKLSRKLPIIFPVHPRTATQIERLGLSGLLERSNIVPVPPLGYLENLGLLAGARIVLTDSGGIQEETTVLGVPCVTFRETTERPVTVTEGTNTVAGTHPDRIIETAVNLLETGRTRGRIPELWDGRSAQRIAGIIRDWMP